MGDELQQLLGEIHGQLQMVIKQQDRTEQRLHDLELKLTELETTNDKDYQSGVDVHENLKDAFQRAWNEAKKAQRQLQEFRDIQFKPVDDWVRSRIESRTAHAKTKELEVKQRWDFKKKLGVAAIGAVGTVAVLLVKLIWGWLTKS